ncbi:trichohyalin isoform X2 [Drosophila serrata]|uniref:trichohyalin isoform X2 n=1 Tax=Drosophila serrata TaxID=7274 RepID=UPI000A1D16A7|nr:trichohyalin isoform X2 [Drosophila serrata]
MTQEANNHLHPSRVREVIQGVDRLVQATNQDLRRFQQEQAQLRENIKGVRTENDTLSSELARYQKLMACGDYQDLSKRLKLTNEALALSKQQVKLLENDHRNLLSVQACSQRTIDNMELELKRYRAQLQDSDDEESSQRYERALKMLEAKVNVQQKEIRTKAETIKVLHDHRQRDVSSLQHQLKECELSLKNTRHLLDASTRRENIAMRKVQEALTLFDEAELARIDAEKQAAASKEEVNHLAGTIGTVMEEAATRVDREMDEFKQRIVEKDKIIGLIKEKMRKEQAEHKTVVHQLEVRNNQLEQKLRDAQKQNVKLEDEVRVACQQINELERSVNDFHNEEEQHSVDKKHYESEIERYVSSCRKLKANYRVAMEDMTQRFEAVIYKLKMENEELQADNRMLKGGAAGDCIQP